MESGSVRKSPYEEGIYFVRDQEWRVGDRYQLLNAIGDGTFSSVCSALDTLTGEQVALKRIPDVLSSPELTKKVVREVCILRRLCHPFIISLRDAFIQPSSSGPMRLVDGRLVSSSLDVYIAMELAQEGDIFNLRGQMSEDEVRALMWQMLQALQYLHGVAVWHRDLKSSNVLLTTSGGHRIVKVADFGSARSATREGYGWAEQGPPEPSAATFTAATPLQEAGKVSDTAADRSNGAAPRTPTLLHQDSFTLPNSQGSGVRAKDLYVLVGQRRTTGSQDGAGVGYQSPLTVMVATPCYRAPEVVMSRGGYTSAIDMWSLGCIFGELLQRMRRVGSASTPHLHVAPMFAIHGVPTTPRTGEKWEDDVPANPTTRSELAALFSVIGTPSWADVARVPSCGWRSYLHKCPGRPPTFFRRFGHAGEATVHLLERLLAFDPERRCSAEEALAHEYFAHLDRSVVHDANDANAELDSLCLHGVPDTGDDFLVSLQSQSSTSPQRASSFPNSQSPIDTPSPTWATTKRRSFEEPRRSSEHRKRPSYCDETDAAKALHMLEDEMAKAEESGHGAERLRALLERECDAQAREGARRLLEEQAAAGKPQSDVLISYATRDGQPISTRFEEDHRSKPPDPAEVGRERLTFVADTWKGALDPAVHLRPGRHGEWTVTSGKGPREGPAWGVNSLPPGMTPEDAETLMRTMSRQQGR